MVQLSWLASDDNDHRPSLFCFLLGLHIREFSLKVRMVQLSCSPHQVVAAIMSPDDITATQTHQTPHRKTLSGFDAALMGFGVNAHQG